jgi:hypothetical protein
LILKPGSYGKAKEEEGGEMETYVMSQLDDKNTSLLVAWTDTDVAASSCSTMYFTHSSLPFPDAVHISPIKVNRNRRKKEGRKGKRKGEKGKF